MVDKLDKALHFNSEALSLRNARQKILANNIANADTPNFKARDIDFSKALKNAVETGRGSGKGVSLATTSDRHIQAQSRTSSFLDLQYRVPDQPSLDGNTVDMDRERTAFADNAVRYQAGLTMLNSNLKRIKSAMQE